MAARRHEHDGGEAVIGLRLLPAARPNPKLALMREGRERRQMSSAMVSLNTVVAMVAAASAMTAMAQGPSPCLERRS
jgi:hypothetical protein